MNEDCIWCTIIERPTFRVGCKACKTILQSNFDKDFKTCSCGLISIDGGTKKKSRRLIGSKSDIELPEVFENKPNQYGKRNRLM
jgi:hypothetical protein